MGPRRVLKRGGKEKKYEKLKKNEGMHEEMRTVDE